MKNFVSLNKAVSEYKGRFGYVLDIVKEVNDKYDNGELDYSVSIADEMLEGYGNCLTITVPVNEDIVIKTYYKDSIAEIECLVRIGTINDVDNPKSYRSYLTNKGIEYSLPEDIMIGDFDRGEIAGRIKKYDNTLEFTPKHKKLLDVISILSRKDNAA